MYTSLVHITLLWASASVALCFQATSYRGAWLRTPMRTSLSMAGDGEDGTFAAWEREEMELQRDELLGSAEFATQKRLNIAADAAGTGPLPSYMEDMLSEYEEFDPTAVPARKLPQIAVIGRPNTGKSTIVNKISDTYKNGAIIHDEPGITRDRTYRTGLWNGYNFQVVDTGGIIFDDDVDEFADRITEQALFALEECNAAIMVCDGMEGVNPLDIALAEWVRKNAKCKVFLAVNKCESATTGMMQAQEFWSLGMGEPYPVSGIHGSGLNDLLDEITTNHMEKVLNVLNENATNIALVGRPNVGKSSLFNRLNGKSRSIVSDVAGTTRDTVDEMIERGNATYRLIDTAGIRKKTKVDYGAEYFMVNRALKAIKRADVVLLMLDATTGIVEQDRTLANRIAEEGRSCVIVLNKWDAIPNKDDGTYNEAVENIRNSLPVLKWAEIVVISAETGQRSDKVLAAVDRAAEQFSRRVPTAVLNDVVNEATMWLAPPKIGSRLGRLYYTFQADSAPPTLVFFCNDPALFTDNYQRYLDRKIRDALKFHGTPIRFVFRGKKVADVSKAARKGDVQSAMRGARVGKGMGKQQSSMP